MIGVNLTTASQLLEYDGLMIEILILLWQLIRR